MAQRLKVLPDLASKFKDAEDGEEDGREEVDEDLVRERALLEIEEALLQVCETEPDITHKRALYQPQKRATHAFTHKRALYQPLKRATHAFAAPGA